MADNYARLLEKFKKDKTPEQCKAIDYFCKEEGCLSKNITDNEYTRMVTKKRDSLKLRTKALNKIGLDEEEISEIRPAVFEGFVFKDAFAKKRADGDWVSSAYQVTWLFFSSTQIHVYRYVFNMVKDAKLESTDEFFYKDVTSLSTISETETARGLDGEQFEVESNRFIMVVPGDKIYVPMEGVHNSEEIIQAMKQKLREKKR